MSIIALACWLVLAQVSSPSGANEPLQISVKVAPRPYYVGQGIEVEITIEGDASPDRPTFVAPRMATVEVFPLSDNTDQPGRALFVVVPGRSGPLDLPPFQARSGARKGSSKRRRLEVDQVPTEGRTLAFLGGVGTFDTMAHLEVSHVAFGDKLDLIIKVNGDAAWGSVRPPDLSEWGLTGWKFELDGETLRAARQPARTFRYRARAVKTGRAVLPPVAISAFDPKTRRFATRVTPSLNFVVDEPPRSPLVRLGPTSLAGRDPSAALLAIVGAWGLLALFAVLGVGWAMRLARRAWIERGLNPLRVARELSAALEKDIEGRETARRVAEALTTFLQRACGRPPGVLTPAEARVGFERLTGDASIGESAEALLAWTDRARFGAVEEGMEGMIEEARRLFGTLAERLAVRGDGRVDGRSGEAVETAGW